MCPKGSRSYPNRVIWSWIVVVSTVCRSESYTLKRLDRNTWAGILTLHTRSEAGFWKGRSPWCLWRGSAFTVEGTTPWPPASAGCQLLKQVLYTEPGHGAGPADSPEAAVGGSLSRPPLPPATTLLRHWLPLFRSKQWAWRQLTGEINFPLMPLRMLDPTWLPSAIQEKNNHHQTCYVLSNFFFSLLRRVSGRHLVSLGFRITKVVGPAAWPSG